MSKATLMKTVMDKFSTLDSSILKSNPITIGEDFTKDIFEILKDEDDEKRKNIIKIGSKRALKLNPKDVVVVTQTKIVIKKFIPPKPKLTPTQKISNFKKIMNKEVLSDFLNAIVEHLVKDELDFTKISNVYFMENHSNLIKSTIHKGLKQQFSKEDDATIELYLAFLIKNYYNKVLELISLELIELLIEKDEDAVKFITYYDGDVEVDEKNGKKYIKPVMYDENGSKWNSSNLLPVVIQHKKDLISLQRKIESIAVLEDELSVLNKEIDELTNNITELEDRDKELNQNREIASKGVAKLQDELSKLKSANQNADTSSISQEIKHLMREEETMFKESQKINAELVKLKGILRDLRSKKKIKDEMLLDDNKKKRALVKSQEVMKEKHKLVVSALMLTLPKMREPY